jgi:hypothetical protein
MVAAVMAADSVADTKPIRDLVIFLSEIQKATDVEHLHILGIGLDKFLHLFICSSLVIAFVFFNKKNIGLVFVSFLIFFKEFFDLGIIYYFAPIPWASFSDSLIDIAVGFLGMGLGLLISRRMVSRSIDA